MIKFPCPKCGVSLKVDENRAGANVPCPQCQTPIVVPSDTTPPLPAPLASEPAISLERTRARDLAETGSLATKSICLITSIANAAPVVIAIQNGASETAIITLLLTSAYGIALAIAVTVIVLAALSVIPLIADIHERGAKP